MNNFIPKDFKYLKVRKKLKFTTQLERKHTELKFGSIGLKCLESGTISAEVLEVLRKSINRKIKKVGVCLFFVHPNISLTKKSSGTRMGKGKGPLDKWVGKVKKGKIIIEFKGVPYNLASMALKAAGNKISMKSKIITNY